MDINNPLHPINPISPFNHLINPGNSRWVGRGGDNKDLAPGRQEVGKTEDPQSEKSEILVDGKPKFVGETQKDSNLFGPAFGIGISFFLFLLFLVVLYEHWRSRKENTSNQTSNSV